MVIYVLDDEPIALRGAIKTIKEVVPDSEITGFGRAKAALEHAAQTKEQPDVVFSDIEMPGISGLEFAVKFKTLCPDSKIIFVTAYSQYALEAFRLHVHGYILKPITAERVKEELEHALKDKAAKDAELDQDTGKEKGRVIGNDSGRNVGGDTGRAANYIAGPNADKNGRQLRAQCFGYFEVFWKGEPLMFGRRQTKELLAYLVDRKGTSCTSEQIAAALWEDEDNMKNLKARIRILISDLRQTLAKIGQDDLIIRRSGQIAIRREGIDCDYYRMLEGDMDAVNAYRGEYMVQYSWAEMTAGLLAFEINSIM